VGRASRARRPGGELPEAEALWRIDPDLSALLEDDADREGGEAPEQRETS
jgi:hypothetical protein